MLNLLIVSPLPLLAISFLLSPPVIAQSPAQAPVAQPQAPVPVAQPQPQAPAPALPGPPNVTAILEKAGHFSTFIRLLQRTQMDDRIYKQLNNSNQGLTIFAPTDGAFDDLKSVINIHSFTQMQRLQLIQFHVLPTYLPLSEFQTQNNPLNTEAGANTDNQFPLNVTTSENQVNITTGFVNTTVSNALYSDDQLVIYPVDKVLLPIKFVPSAPPALAPSKPEKEAPPSYASKPSGTMSLIDHGINSVSFVVSVIAAFSVCL